MKILKYMQKQSIKKNGYCSLSNIWKLYFKNAIIKIKF